MRTDAGTDHQARTSFDTASNATGNYAALNFVALTENSDAPDAGDTTLTGEITDDGLQRVQATYAHTNGTALVSLTKTFTKGNGATKTPAKAGLFNAAAAGTMGYETLVPNPPPLVENDQVSVTWDFNL